MQKTQEQRSFLIRFTREASEMVVDSRTSFELFPEELFNLKLGRPPKDRDELIDWFGCVLFNLFFEDEDIKKTES